MNGGSWLWVGALLFTSGLFARITPWREERAGQLQLPATLVRQGASIAGAASRGADGRGAVFGSGLADLEAQVDHTGPGGADFWSAHGIAFPTGPGAPEDPNGVLPLRFVDLVLPDYDPEQRGEDGTRPPAEELFPPPILALSGRRVALEGFVQPIEGRGSRIVLFSLLPFPPNCLFGGALRADQQVEVSAHGLGGVQVHPFLPVRVEGALSVGEDLDAFGFVRSVYRLEAELVERLQ